MMIILNDQQYKYLKYFEPEFLKVNKVMLLNVPIGKQACTKIQIEKSIC